MWPPRKETENVECFVLSKLRPERPTKQQPSLEEIENFSLNVSQSMYYIQSTLRIPYLLQYTQYETLHENW